MSKIIDLESFRRNKNSKEIDFNKTKQTGAEFGDRLSRIKESLDKINRLMNELKKMSANSDRRNETDR